MSAQGTMLDVIEGVTPLTNRQQFKATFANFGEVIDCFNPRSQEEKRRAGEFPYIRYRSSYAAEAALAACESGIVFLDGRLVRARWRQSAPKRPPEAAKNDTHYDLRDFRSRGRSRHRSTSRGRKRSRSRSRHRSSHRGSSPPRYRSRSGK
mmetsp:Transcript_128/g.357  ORF Transcript_128/g.357 Transcript_128/m.357 type:complete len:151 (-) Transcript_128:83-535(-)